VVTLLPDIYFVILHAQEDQILYSILVTLFQNCSIGIKKTHPGFLFPGHVLSFNP
jgi:hypothetical protein